MNPKSVELIADHPVHGVKGKKFDLPEKDADTLIAAGVAKSGEIDTTQSIADTITTTVIGAVDKRLDDRFKTFEEAQGKTLNGHLAKSFGGLHHAQPKDADLESRYGFKNCTEFCLAVKNASMPGRSVDERLLNAKAPSGMNTIVGEQGGFLVPAEMSNNIMEMVWNKSNLLARTDQHRLAGGSLILKAINETSRATGSRRGGVQAYWMDEAEQYTASKPKFRKLELKPNKLGVFFFVTDEQLDDTQGYNLEQKLTQYAGEEISWMVEDAIINGDGVGKPLGILNSPAYIEVAKETSPAQAATTVVWQNFIKMYSRMLSGSLGNAVWLMNSDVYPSLFSMVGPKSDGTSMLYTSGNGYPTAAGAPFGTVLGRPIIVTEHNATLGTPGDVLFVDLAWYATVTKGGVNQAMSIHLRFDYGETAFRYDFRVDGQPWLNSAITPANGTTTQSPFIGLAVRA